MMPAKKVAKKEKPKGKPGKSAPIIPLSGVDHQATADAEKVKVNIGGKTVFVSAVELQRANELYGSLVEFNAQLVRFDNRGVGATATIRVERDHINNLGRFEELFSGFPVEIIIKSGNDHAFSHKQNLAPFEQIRKGTRIFKEFDLEFGQDFEPETFLRIWGTGVTANIRMFHEVIPCELDDQRELPLETAEKTEAENQAAINTLEDGEAVN
jgi:hypothetical protein